MKKVALAVVLMALAGCDAKSNVMHFDAELPDGFKDCAFAKMLQKDGATYVIGRCPNSTTTVSQKQGKTQTSVAVVDGVEYVQKEQ